ncbi:hypothetical protein ACFQ73_13430 [Amycolatopsis japonica]|uniref:aspartate racemase/maleate isomerase family protein n=1 Tax=Amycolatopsis japonica TaxID=208439 RepID=UPI00366D5BC3
MIGLLYPTRDCGEDDFLACARKLDPDLTVDFAYVPWGEDIGRVDDLDPAEKHEAVSRACSRCSFTRGLAGAREQASVLSERLGVPAHSTSLAYLTALAHLGTKRVALAPVYHRVTTTSFVDFLTETVIETVHSVSADAPSDRALGALGTPPVRRGLGTLFSR